MLKINRVVTSGDIAMDFIIEGMRNPMNSWDKSDSGLIFNDEGYADDPAFELGENDKALMKRLADAGPEHRKFMRMMNVYVRVTAPLYWWKEFDTYRAGVVPNPLDIEMNSCSTMHKIHAKEFTRDNFSWEHLYGDYVKLLDDTIDVLNMAREKYLETKEKDYWWQMIQLLPTSYNQTRNLSLNYEALRSIYHQRKNHKLDEWHTFCDWIEELPYSFLITGEE